MREQRFAFGDGLLCLCEVACLRDGGENVDVERGIVAEARGIVVAKADEVLIGGFADKDETYLHWCVNLLFLLEETKEDEDNSLQ